MMEQEDQIVGGERSETSTGFIRFEERETFMNCEWFSDIQYGNLGGGDRFNSEKTAQKQAQVRETVFSSLPPITHALSLLPLLETTSYMNATKTHAWIICEKTDISVLSTCSC